MHTHTDNRLGLALSLASSLEPSSALAKRALGHGAKPRAEDLDALLSQLLTETDRACVYPEDGVLDADFDDL
jgi:hypothetical protein